ncbi:MAG: DEAD/DEAH box helicase family protein [Anaerolineae bacterium]|nr:DEAD/DEAH box helicase family protein [Anaerolineae bacterium]
MPSLREEFDTLVKYTVIKQDVPGFIAQNLNPAFELRPYQINALARFFFYINDFKDRARPTQLLFHMATGSGKTVIMAAAILYLYERGYRHFVFFVNSTNIIEKTRDNFLNPLSSKYLFAEPIKFGPKQVQIREVENFEIAGPDDISILFTTIQGLHTRLNTPRENALTYQDFANKRIVLISDEAHHINALTKSSLTQTEAEEEKTWEATVNKIFTTHVDNLLLEFTATVELSHPAVKTKYDNKILYQYSLKEFREDGYSKEVKVLQADLEPIDRALQAVVLSQYRRKVAEKHRLQIKPVLLMKSRTIAESETFEAEFHTAIRELTVERLQTIKAKAAAPSVQHAFHYFASGGISLENLVTELKADFNPDHCLSVNSKSDSEEKQLLVNSLEDRDNQIRVVFAVDKLNEGWDVLNLFDIVRLYDTRDAKQGRPGPTTIAEAQLIGRGARYFPFQLNKDQTRHKRKFDEDLDNELRVLEELYYHSAHNPRYIQELRQALVETGIMPDRTREIQVKIKESFKQSDFWQNGMIFLNKRIRNDRANITGLSDIQFTDRHTYRLRTGFAQDSVVFEDSSNGSSNATMSQTYNLLDFGPHLIRKALNKLTFYHFDNLKQYFPQLESITQFITTADFLGRIQIEVIGPAEQINRLSPAHKLDTTLHVLTRLSAEIQTGTAEFIGTKEFKPEAIQLCLKDKTLNIVLDDTGDKEFGWGMRESRNIELILDLQGQDWYVYDENYGTAEEKYFVKFIYSAIEKLKRRYDTIYLLRNERLFQIYRFSDGRAIEPDFALFLIEKASGKSIMYQLFIEPKGAHLLREDKWKEDFLKEIEREYQILVMYESKEFKLYGMPFYNEQLTKTEFEDRFSQFLS